MGFKLARPKECAARRRLRLLEQQFHAKPQVVCPKECAARRRLRPKIKVPKEDTATDTVRRSAPLEGDCDASLPVIRICRHQKKSEGVRRSKAIATLRNGKQRHSSFVGPKECAARRRLRPCGSRWPRRSDSCVRRSAPLEGDCDRSLLHAARLFFRPDCDIRSRRES